MKLKLRNIAAAIMIAATSPAFAQLSESFEPVQGGLSTRDALIQQNWLLPDMDVNVEGTSPITGAQSLASGPSYKPDQGTGVVTPYLSFSNSETFEFKFNLHRPAMPGDRRWFLVYVGDTLGVPTLIDSVEVNAQSTAVNTYTLPINNYEGVYCIYVNFRGNGSNSKFVMDDLSFTGSNANMPYAPHFEVQGTTGIRNYDKDNSSINVFPNPANDQVNVKIASNKNQEGSVEIYNISGAKLLSQPAMFTNGSNTINLNTSSLSPGNYFLTVKTEEGMFAKRFTRMP